MMMIGKLAISTTAVVWLVFSSLLLSNNDAVAAASSVEKCSSDYECEILLGHGTTKCLPSGRCSNPFHEGGCLQNYLSHSADDDDDDDDYKKTLKKKLRMCHSDDPPDAYEKGFCQINPLLDYLVVRIHGQDWETANINAWIIQIVLSELLEVPASIEKGSYGSELDFYNVECELEYWSDYDFNENYQDLSRASSSSSSEEEEIDIGGDCRLLKNDPEKEEVEYKSCSHIHPEVWAEDIPSDLSTIKGIEENLYDVGMLGGQGWYLPLFTVKQDLTLTNYIGYQGEHNRPKLAETFKRPTNWKQYCQEVSPNNCSSPDIVAQRPPEDEEEEDSYFLQGEFTGYFRYTPENNCTLNPQTCTGHFVEYQCGWGSYFPQQSYHLNISLQSSGPDRNGGYDIEHILQIYRAANATKENVIGMASYPDFLTSEFIGTEMEFQRVALPVPTQECLDNRVDISQRCEECCGTKDEFLQRFGKPEGSCDNPGFALKRMIGTALRDNDLSLPEGLRSPAYSFLTRYKIDNIQMDQIFSYVLENKNNNNNKTDAQLPLGYSMRDATCRWVSENIDVFLTVIPDTYPRTIHEDNRWEDPLYLLSFLWACFAVNATVVAAVATYVRRKHAAIRFAQLDFLSLLLVGLLLVAMGSAVSIAVPSEFTCMVSHWLLMLGYTLEMVPLIIKVAAINKVMMAAKKLKKVNIEKSKLYQYVAALSCVTIVFLILWTAIDPEVEEGIYTITGEATENGETIVYVEYQCSSESEVWGLVYFCGHTSMLLCATVLAIQNRKLEQAFNEAQVLAILMYSHCVFLVSRIILYMLEEGIGVRFSSVLNSLSFSTDVIVAISIYFVPKIIAKDQEESHSSRSARVSGIDLHAPASTIASTFICKNCKSLQLDTSILLSLQASNNNEENGAKLAVEQHKYPLDKSNLLSHQDSNNKGERVTKEVVEQDKHDLDTKTNLSHQDSNNSEETGAKRAVERHKHHLDTSNLPSHLLNSKNNEERGAKLMPEQHKQDQSETFAADLSSSSMMGNGVEYEYKTVSLPPKSKKQNPCSSPTEYFDCHSEPSSSEDDR